MRAIVVVAIAAGLFVSGCGQPKKAEEPALSAPSAPVDMPQAVYAPMSQERTALCASALEAWKGLGLAKPPGATTAEAYGERAPLIGLRAMELELADKEGFAAQRATAEAAWKDKTPADIEAATAACLTEIKP